MTTRATRKLLIVGWDAADWKVIDPLLARGAMPNLARVIKGGVRADLATLEPKLSPILWTSIATGKTADKHGILNFVEPDPVGGSVRISSSTTRRTKALWNILTQAGLRSNVVSWYASHPAEPIAGACVSNLFQEGLPPSPADPWPLPPGAVHPAGAGAAIAAARVHPAQVQPYQLLALVPGLSKAPRKDPRFGHLARNLAECLSVHNAATELLRRDPSWDCTMVFYNTIDVVGHHFMQYYPPRMAHVSAADFELFRQVMPGIYRLQDSMLGALLDLAGPGATLMLLSDHGFHSDHLRPLPKDEHENSAAMDAASHRALGVLAMSGPGVAKGAKANGATLLDIAPTALALLGLARGADMDGRVLSEALSLPGPFETVPSWDEIDSPAGAGQHPPDLRQDPFEAREAMAQLVDLGYLAAPTGDAEAQLELVSRESRFNLGVVYMSTGRVTEALPIFEELHRAHPGEHRYVMSYARCCSDRGRFADARAVLRGYLDAHPDDTGTRINLGATLFAEGRLGEAADLLEPLQSVVAPEGRADLECLLGTVYFYMRRPNDAQRVFSRALASDRASHRAHHGLALASLGMRRFEKAAEHCLAALSLSPAYTDAHYTLGAALAWMGDHGRALQSFRLALTLQPGLIDAHLFIAEVLDARQDGPGAADHRARAEELVRQRGGADTQSAPEPPFGPAEWGEARRG